MTSPAPTGDREPLAEPSARVVLTWVALYTRGLPAQLADDRRAEIESDLWEASVAAVAHGPPLPMGGQRLGRLVRGIPADLAWRFEHRHAHRTREVVMRPSILEWVLLLGAGLLCAVALAGGAVAAIDPNDDWDSWGPVAAFAAGVLGLIGLTLSVSRPAAGLGVVIVAVVIGTATMPWLWPFTLLVLLAAFARWAITRGYGATPAG
jgi:hypothetical protein